MSKEVASNNLKNAVAKGLLWGGMSNVVCQLLSLLFGIYLARILGPSDYGPIGMIAIFSAIAGSLQDSGFVAAIANRKEVGSTVTGRDQVGPPSPHTGPHRRAPCPGYSH